MSIQIACDVCHFYKQGTVHRYGLSRQEKVPGVTRSATDHRALYKRSSNWGGIDLCDECWEKVGKPKQRPELRGKTGPKR